MTDGTSRAAIAAIFDVDNTLLPGTSAERLFVTYLLRRRLVGARGAFGTLLALLRYIRLGPARTLRQHRPYLRGWQVERLRVLGEEVVREIIVPRLSRGGVARVREHDAAGHRTALVSGSLPFLLGPLGRWLGVEVVIGTPLAVSGDAYTGALSGAHLYGAEKAVVTRRFAAARGVDLRVSYGYADQHSDLPFLALFGHPVCVNPTPRLRRLAARRGWPVEEWRDG